MNSRNRKRTLVVTLSICGLAFFLSVGLALYDVWTYVEHGNETTISQVFAELFARSPWLTVGAVLAAFIGGTVFGHVAWPQRVVARLKF